MSEPDKSTVWLKVAALDELPEGRVKTVSLEQGTKSKAICLTHHNGQYGALDNHCPHQGGPLGEGSIENGYLRCPCWPESNRASSSHQRLWKPRSLTGRG